MTLNYNSLGVGERKRNTRDKNDNNVATEKKGGGGRQKKDLKRGNRVLLFVFIL